MTYRSITTVLACTFAAGAIGSAAVAATPTAAAPAARVAYADLDLSSAAGQRTLAHRLSGAVSLVCPAETIDRYVEQACRRSAFDRAHADLHKAGVPAF